MHKSGDVERLSRCKLLILLWANDKFCKFDGKTSPSMYSIALWDKPIASHFVNFLKLFGYKTVKNLYR